MSLQYLGQQTILVALPILAPVNAALSLASASLSLRFAALTQQLGLSVGLKIPNPVAIVGALQAQITALPTLLLRLPDASIRVTTGLNAQIGMIKLQLDGIRLMLELISLAATGRVFLYAWEGPTNQMGGAISSAILTGLPGGAGPTAQSYAVVLGTESAATWGLLAKFVKTG